MHEYGPDGGWAEGPGYWSYATRYTVYLLAALQTALGTDGGLSKTPGFDKAGDFRFYFVGPTDLTFNYADASDKAGSPAEMFWLARRFDQPLYAWHERQCKSDGDPMNLLWFDPRGDGPKAAGLPLDRVFRGVNVAFLRSAWQDQDALFVAFKGGSNKANHSHLDLGTFVLDALGQRWALDLGGDDYNLPGYFGNKRWTYYRLMTESHNTLLISGENQNPRAKAPVVAFASANGVGSAVADLTAAYPKARSVQRGIRMEGARRIIIQDEVEADAPLEVLWGMLTFAKPAAQGPAVVLEQGGKRMYGRILAPAGATFDTVGANPPPPQRQQPDAKKLVVRLPEKVKSLRLVVVFSPDPAGAGPDASAVKPLAEWPGRIAPQ